MNTSTVHASEILTEAVEEVPTVSISVPENVLVVADVDDVKS